HDFAIARAEPIMAHRAINVESLPAPANEFFGDRHREILHIFFFVFSGDANCIRTPLPNRDRAWLQRSSRSAISKECTRRIRLRDFRLAIERRLTTTKQKK